MTEWARKTLSRRWTQAFLEAPPLPTLRSGSQDSVSVVGPPPLPPPKDAERSLHSSGGERAGVESGQQEGCGDL